MKKSLVLMAMTGVALASCVNDVADVAQKEQKKAIIGFDAPVLYNNAESRANVYGEIGNVVVDGVTYSYPQDEDFIIYASGLNKHLLDEDDDVQAVYHNWDE